MENNNQKKSDSGRVIQIILLSIIALLVILYFAMDLFISETEKPILFGNNELETVEDRDKAATYFSTQKTIFGQKKTTDQSSSFFADLIARQLVNQQSPPAEDCRKISLGMDEFYQFLETQDFNDGKRPKNIKITFMQITAKLLANPPIVVRETDNLMNILQNAAHLFRVIGKEDLNLLRSILNQEKNQLEEAMVLFYHWTKIEGQCEAALNIHLPLNGLYEYAGFFINTLGGQSYLYRRNHSIRTLIKYYVVLILDRANEQMQNKHGIDIRPLLLSVLADFEIAKGLRHVDLYLENLHFIRQKYPTS